MTRAIPKTSEFPIWQQYAYSPFAGVAAIVFFTVVAISCIPEDHAPKGALFWSGFWMSIGILYAPVVGVYRNPKTLIHAENILALIPVFWLLLDLLQGTYGLEEAKHEAVVKCFVAIATFSSALCIGRWLKFLKMPQSLLNVASNQFSAPALFHLILLCFVLGITRFAAPCYFNPVDMAYYLFVDRFGAPWARAGLGGWDAFLDFMQYFGYLLPALTVMLAAKTRWLNWRVATAAALTIGFSLFLSQGGNRRIVGTIFGVAIAIWMLANRKHSVRSILTMVIVVGGLLWWMQFMLKIRSVGLGGAISSGEVEINLTGQARSTEEKEDAAVFNVDDNFLRLAQVIDLFPATQPFVHQKFLVYALVRPIPRVFWEGKPLDGGYDLTALLGMQGFSLTTSIVGEAYISFGYVGIVLFGLLIGGLAGMASQVLEGEMTPERALVYSILVMALFAGGRSTLELILMSYMLVAWSGVLWAYRLMTGRG